jgi:hypothetical protein
VDSAIFEAVKRVYNPRFMKEIESSFAIDEDEEGALPTLRDLQARVQDPMAAMKARAERTEERLKRIEVGREPCGTTRPALHRSAPVPCHPRVCLGTSVSCSELARTIHELSKQASTASMCVLCGDGERSRTWTRGLSGRSAAAHWAGQLYQL